MLDQRKIVRDGLASGDVLPNPLAEARHHLNGINCHTTSSSYRTQKPISPSPALYAQFSGLRASSWSAGSANLTSNWCRRLRGKNPNRQTSRACGEVGDSRNRYRIKDTPARRK